MSMARKDFGISCFQALLFFIEVILPGLSAYGLATVLLSDVAQCGYIYYHFVVPSAGVSSGPALLLVSGSFILVLVRALLTQLHSTMFVISFATLCRGGLFRARAMAILAGLRKRTVPNTFFQALAILGNYVAVLRPAFREIHDRGDREKPLMLLLGGTIYLAGMVCNAICAVPVLEDASDSGFGAMRRRLALVGAGNCWTVALLGGIFVPVAVPTATVLSSHVLVAGTAIHVTMQCTMVGMMLVAQPLVYKLLWKGYHSL